MWPLSGTGVRCQPADGPGPHEVLELRRELGAAAPRRATGAAGSIKDERGPLTFEARELVELKLRDALIRQSHPCDDSRRRVNKYDVRPRFVLVDFGDRSALVVARRNFSRELHNDSRGSQ